MMKRWWIIGIGMVLATSGCKFVERQAEQQMGRGAIYPARTDTGEGLPLPGAGGTASTETLRPSPPTTPEEKPEVSPAAIEAESTEKEAQVPESSGTGGEETPPLPSEGSVEAGSATEESASPPAAEEAEPKPGAAPALPEEEAESQAPAEEATEGIGPAKTSQEKPAEAPAPEKAEAEGTAKETVEAPSEEIKEPATATAMAEQEPDEEREEVPGGGVGPRSEERVALKPEPTETPSERGAPPEQKTETRAEEKEGRLPAEAEEAAADGVAEREQMEAQRKAWEEAETIRETQRQAGFAALMFYLTRVEDALDGKKNDLSESLYGLQRVRRSLHFLRSDLTPAAIWYHLDCALALLQNEKTEEAKGQLDLAIRLAPVIVPGEEEESSAPSEATDEAPSEERAAPDEAPGGEEEDSEAQSHPEAAANPEETPQGDEDERESETQEPDLHALLTTLRGLLEEDSALEEATEELEKLLSGAPPSDVETLMDAIEAEIDYTLEALNRASRKTAEVELASLRANLEELAHLVLGESALAEAPWREEETGAEEGEGEGEGTSPSVEDWLREEEEVPADRKGSTLSREPGSERTSHLPAAALLGTLTLAGLVWSRTRRFRDKKGT